MCPGYLNANNLINMAYICIIFGMDTQNRKLYQIFTCSDYCKTYIDKPQRSTNVYVISRPGSSFSEVIFFCNMLNISYACKINM